MIQEQTILKVTDNSGAKLVKCIKVPGGFKNRVAYLGDIILISVKKLRNKSKLISKVNKGEIFKAIIIRTKYKKVRKDGCLLFFNENSVSLLNKQYKPLGTRILGPVFKELKYKYSKVASISSGLV